MAGSAAVAAGGGNAHADGIRDLSHGRRWQMMRRSGGSNHYPGGACSRTGSRTGYSERPRERDPRAFAELSLRNSSVSGVTSGQIGGHGGRQQSTVGGGAFISTATAGVVAPLALGAASQLDPSSAMVMTNINKTRFFIAFLLGTGFVPHPGSKPSIGRRGQSMLGRSLLAGDVQ